MLRIAGWILGALLLTSVVVGSFAYYWYFKAVLPEYEGHMQMQHLNAPVHVLRDEHGVPHIFAQNRADALRALGYVHASERFFQMEMQRRAGQGRLAEVAGKDLLGVDKFVRTLGLYRLAQSSFQTFSPEAQGLFKAYSDGVNDWFAANRSHLPVEIQLLNIKPELWQPADSVVWGKLMALQLSKNLELEKLRAVLAQADITQIINAQADSPENINKSDINAKHTVVFENAASIEGETKSDANIKKDENTELRRKLQDIFPIRLAENTPVTTAPLRPSNGESTAKDVVHTFEESKDTDTGSKKNIDQKERGQSTVPVVSGKAANDDKNGNKAVGSELLNNKTPQKPSQILPQVKPEKLQPAANDKKHKKTQPNTTKPDHSSQSQILQFAASEKLGQIVGMSHGASNEWVVSGNHTQSGKPLLANDPHLGLEAPILWYLARIITPDDDLKGATVPGLPVFLLGQNKHIAWGFTTTGSDVQDLFIETLAQSDGNVQSDGKAQTAEKIQSDGKKYVTPQGTESFKEREEVIHIKGEMDMHLRVRETRHGPVLSDIDAELAKIAGNGKVAALAFTGLGATDKTAQALLELNAAANWEQFLAALRAYEAPPQNIVYADTEGHIGYINPGLVPVRAGRADGRAPADGASGIGDWVGQVPFTQVPQLYDPPSGLIFNANNAVVNVTYPYWLGMDWEEPFRAQRLQTLLYAKPKFSLDDFSKIQMDSVSPVAAAFIPYISALKMAEGPEAVAQKMLANWDGQMLAGRPEPLIFDLWLRAFGHLVLTQPLQNNLAAKGPFKAAALLQIVAGDQASWCNQNVAKPCDSLMMQALQQALKDGTAKYGADFKAWQWGQAHRATLTNKVMGKVPVIKNFANISLASDGDFYTINRGGSFSVEGEEPFAKLQGGGYRGIYDLARPENSRFMIATGQSGHVFSPHYSDLATSWNKGESITLFGTRDDLLQKGAKEWLFLPE